MVEQITSIFVVRCDIACRLLLELAAETGDNSFGIGTVEIGELERRARYSLPVPVDSIHDEDIFRFVCDVGVPIDVRTVSFNGIKLVSIEFDSYSRCRS